MQTEPRRAQDQQTRKEKSVTHDVMIGLDANKAVTVTPDKVYAARGDEIEFDSDVGDWDVDFVKATPCDGSKYKSKRKSPKKVKIKGNAEHKTYKYDVHLTVDGQTYSVDPEVIVGPGK